MIANSCFYYFILPTYFIGAEPSDWSIDNVQISHLTGGDTIDLQCFKITPASYKQSLAGREHVKVAEISHDIFANDKFEFNKIATSLFDSSSESTYGNTLQSSPVFTVSMAKSWDNEVVTASAFDGVYPETGEYTISYYHMRVGVTSKK